MCGRYALTADADELAEAFDVPVPDFGLVPRYNIAPSQPAPVVAEDRRGRRIGLLDWGLVPSWVDEPGAGLINARCETVMHKPAFREAFERRRCLVPADGFYEWRPEGGSKVPYWFHSRDGSLVSYAGIWERWSRPGREPRHTFAILTTASTSDVEEIHDRMPVIVAASDRDAWLDRATALDRLTELLRGPPEGSLVHHRVSRRVNRPAEDDAGLIEPDRD